MKNSSATKRGPGRYVKHSKPGRRLTKPHAQRAYEALMAAWASRRVTKAKRHDEYGSYTLVGKPRRKWLAGISAQRGY